MAKGKKRKGRGSIQGMVDRQKRLLEAGKTKKAGRVGSRIARRAQKNPGEAAPVGEMYAEKEFEKNLQANRPDQVTIGGSQTYTTDPETGKVTVTQSLSPEQQALYDQQVQQTQAGNKAFQDAFSGLSGLGVGTAYDFSGAPAAPQGGLGGRQRYEDAYMASKTRQLDQSYDRRRAQLQDELASRGNQPGTPAWNEAMDRLNEGYDEQLDTFGDKAITHAGTEFQRGFGIDQAARQSAIQEQILGRTQPLQELGALKGFGGGPTTNPNFMGFQPVQYQGPNYLGYLQTGLEAELGRGALAQPVGGGFGAPQPAPPPFSIGGAPGALPAPGNPPNPVAGGFAAGFGAGVPVGVAVGR